MRWLAAEAGEERTPELEALREVAAEAGAGVVIGAARAGAAEDALRGARAVPVAVRAPPGPYGVAAWSARVESWLGAAIEDFGLEQRWYVGRPLLVTENDYELGLLNGDTGVVVARPEGRLSAVFERRSAILEFSPARLGAVDTLFAMTIHKSQGSQFQTAAVVLPSPDSRLLSRELLYTAVTRAQQRLIVAGSEAAIRAAVERPIARASGLRDRVWGEAGTPSRRFQD